MILRLMAQDTEGDRARMAAKKTVRKKVAQKPAAARSAARKAAGRKPARPVLSGPEEVEALMKSLKHPLKAEIEAVRAIIRGASKKLQERVKWKAPSFHCQGIDLGAFNLHQTGFAQLILVFPRGIPAETGTGVMEGAWKDRREVRFHDMEDVRKKKAGLVRVVKAWVVLMEGE